MSSVSKKSPPHKTTENGQAFKPANSYWPETHEVFNQPDILQDYNLYEQDKALKQAVWAHGGGWGEPELDQFGEITGSAEVITWGFQANENKPTLHTHNPRGVRIDEVRFHPAYHELMRLSIREGLHGSHWSEPRPGAHVVRAAKSYMMTQVEAGHGCPVTMTSASIPTLQKQPDLYATWAPKILTREYDPRNLHHDQKKGLTIGMAMTEKQGGSDVRRNTTRACPLDHPGPGQAYELVGHKYFVSAPMSDAFLVLAQAEGGISCFLVPRWHPDGSQNPLQILCLKNKMGNASNASSETELRGALGWLVGEEGRGVAVILKMVAMTRFDCMVGSAAGMRQAVAQVTHHCSQRSVFGHLLTEQRLMQNVLADLILENEGAVAFAMRIAHSLDHPDDEHEQMLMRMGTAVGKYWICKRAPGHAYEAMECIGGSAVMEDLIMARLFRESPVNAIWEGSGNVQCLDMLRALHKSPASLEAFHKELSFAKGADRFLDQAITRINSEFARLDNVEYRARSIVGRMALAFQASTLFQYGDTGIAEAFCASRLNPENQGWVYGTLPENIDCKTIIERGTPHI
ncbi:MAG: acyl-CoA dehydrogenase family protein [Lysobacterales bacterium]